MQARVEEAAAHNKRPCRMSAATAKVRPMQKESQCARRVERRQDKVDRRESVLLLRRPQKMEGC